jgi:hypothetical protein
MTSGLCAEWHCPSIADCYKCDKQQLRIGFFGDSHSSEQQLLLCPGGLIGPISSRLAEGKTIVWLFRPFPTFVVPLLGRAGRGIENRKAARAERLSRHRGTMAGRGICLKAWCSGAVQCTTGAVQCTTGAVPSSSCHFRPNLLGRRRPHHPAPPREATPTFLGGPYRPLPLAGS